MPNKSMFSPSREKRLLRVTRDKNTKATLTALATAWGMTYPNLYAAWNTRMKKAAQWNQNGKTDKPLKKGNVQLYVLEEDVTVVPRNQKALRVEVLSKLKPTIDKMEVGKHTLPIHRADMVAMREVVGVYQNKQFGFTKIPDNPQWVRMYRKV